MRKTHVWITLSFCLLTMATIAPAQNRKAGLWEITSKTTFQQPGNVGMFSATQSGQAPSGDIPAVPVCLSKELIEKFGVVLPPSLRDCQLTNVVNKPDSLMADLTCTGRSNGKGTIETSWSDDGHATGKIHFSSKAKAGPDKTVTMTWTQDSTAVFKSEDCGSVSPRKMPASTEPAK